MESGEIKASTPSGNVTVSAGQAIFHAPGEIHHHYNDTEKNAVIIDIVFSTQSQYMNNLNSALLALTGAQILKLGELLNICIIPETGDYPEESGVKRQSIKNNLELFLLEVIYTHLQGLSDDTSRKYYDII